MKRHAMSRRKVRGPTFSSRPLEAAWLSLCFSSACSAASRIWWASLLARRSASAFFRASSICWLQTARFHDSEEGKLSGSRRNPNENIHAKPRVPWLGADRAHALAKTICLLTARSRTEFPVSRISHSRGLVFGGALNRWTWVFRRNRPGDPAKTHRRAELLDITALDYTTVAGRRAAGHPLRVIQSPEKGVFRGRKQVLAPVRNKALENTISGATVRGTPSLLREDPG
jgi:hypothetical protein